MYWTSALAIYVIFWFFCLFLVLPFHARKADDQGVAPVRGQADSAPAYFNAGKVAWQTSLVAAILFGAYYLNYNAGWVTPDDINFFPPPPSAAS
jgi:predicted secreted protein